MTSGRFCANLETVAPAYRPSSGRGPGCGFASDRAIGLPSCSWVKRDSAACPIKSSKEGSYYEKNRSVAEAAFPSLLNDLASLLNDDDKKYEWPMKCTAGTFTGGYWWLLRACDGRRSALETPAHCALTSEARRCRQTCDASRRSPGFAPRLAGEGRLGPRAERLVRVRNTAPQPDS